MNLSKLGFGLGSAFAAMVAGAPALAICPTDSCTTIPVGTVTSAYDFLATLNSDGSISSNLGHSGIGDGTFTDTYTFTILADGLGSGTISTGTSVLLSSTDLDFISVLVNGTPADFSTHGNSEYESADNVAITSGVENTIVVTGLSRGNGSYGGNATFVPYSSLPEPQSWGMMILGFAAIGTILRQRKTAVRFG